jgi:hypothetical protein
VKFDGTTLYVIHGWKVEGVALQKCLMELTPAVIEIGMRLVFPKDEKWAFFGEILAKAENEASAVRVLPPAPGAALRMAHALKQIGLDKQSMDAPLIWVVLG